MASHYENFGCDDSDEEKPRWFVSSPHPKYTPNIWRDAVQSGLTEYGYHDWVVESIYQHEIDERERLNREARVGRLKEKVKEKAEHLAKRTHREWKRWSSLSKVEQDAEALSLGIGCPQ